MGQEVVMSKKPNKGKNLQATKVVERKMMSDTHREMFSLGTPRIRSTGPAVGGSTTTTR